MLGSYRNRMYRDDVASSDTPVTLTLVGKADCRLCDAMRDVARRVAPAFGARLMERDVASDPDLERRYLLEIPVLLLEDREIAHHRTDEAALRLELREAGLEERADRPLVTRLVSELLREGRPVSLPVTGSSMAPFMRSGDLLSIRPPDVRPRLGDVVVRVEPGERLLIHRVIARRADSLSTRGDAAAAPDPPAPLSGVVGVVEHIERGGRSVGLGLGPERVPIALLSRLGLLASLLRPIRFVLRGAG
jgi:hypothetical protein